MQGAEADQLSRDQLIDKINTGIKKRQGVSIVGMFNRMNLSESVNLQKTVREVE